MQIERDLIEKMSLQEFADRHNLVMRISERRPPLENLERFIASFKNVEVVGDGVLSSLYGDGPTEEIAMQNYAKQLSHTLIAVDAYSPKRREIQCPELS